MSDIMTPPRNAKDRLLAAFPCPHFCSHLLDSKLQSFSGPHEHFRQCI